MLVALASGTSIGIVLNGDCGCDRKLLWNSTAIGVTNDNDDGGDGAEMMLSEPVRVTIL